MHFCSNIFLFSDSLFDKFPFFLPCLLNCAALLLTVVLAYFYLPETLVTRLVILQFLAGYKYNIGSEQPAVVQEMSLRSGFYSAPLSRRAHLVSCLTLSLPRSHLFSNSTNCLIYNY